MQELRQKYQRDHRERQGRYVDDVIGDEEARDEDRRSRDREDEGYGDGSPSSPRVGLEEYSHINWTEFKDYEIVQLI